MNLKLDEVLDEKCLKKILKKQMESWANDEVEEKDGVGDFVFEKTRESWREFFCREEMGSVGYIF